MNTTMLLPATPPQGASLVLSARRGLARAWEREPRLARYGVLLLVLLIPMAIAWALDDRTLRGSNVWIKPLKFGLSISCSPSPRHGSPGTCRRSAGPAGQWTGSCGC